MINLRQATVGTTASNLVTMPPGPCAVTFTVLSPSGAVVYFGTGSGSVSTTNGYPVSQGGQTLTVQGYPGSVALNIQAVSSSAATTVGFAISTPQ